MGAARQHPQQVFSTHDGHHKALDRAVNGRDEQYAARRQASCGSGQKGRHVAHVFDHLERQHHIKAFLRRQHRCGLAQPIVNRNALRLSVQAGSGDVTR